MSEETDKILPGQIPVELDPNDPLVRFIKLKQTVAAEQSEKDISEDTLQRDLRDAEEASNNEFVPIHQAGQIIRDMMTEVLSRSKVSRRFKKDLRNTHCRVLLSLYKRQRLLGALDKGVTLAQIRQDITPKCRLYVEPVLHEAQEFGLILKTLVRGKEYYSLNVMRAQDVQVFLDNELRG